jgi:hypothetical protein
MKTRICQSSLQKKFWRLSSQFRNKSLEARIKVSLRSRAINIQTIQTRFLMILTLKDRDETSSTTQPLMATKLMEKNLQQNLTTQNIEMTPTRRIHDITSKTLP